jgi:hypothetical protein
MLRYGKYKLVTPIHNFKLTPKLEIAAIYTSDTVKKLWICYSNLSYDDFSQKKGGHNILWSAFYFVF